MDLLEKAVFEKAPLEEKRKDRWWATYNAAVTGFLAGPDAWDLEVLDDQARDVADRAHGPLKA